MVEFTRKEYNIIAKNRGIEEPQNMSTQELLNISKNEVNKAEKLQKKSIDELRQIAGCRRIKNREKLTKENLIISAIKSESSAAEQDFKKHFDNNTYDDKIRGKISDIRIILSSLGNIVTNKDRKKIKRELYEIAKKKNLSSRKKRDS